MSKGRNIYAKRKMRFVETGHRKGVYDIPLRETFIASSQKPLYAAVVLKGLMGQGFCALGEFSGDIFSLVNPAGADVLYSDLRQRGSREEVRRKLMECAVEHFKCSIDMPIRKGKFPDAGDILYNDSCPTLREIVEDLCRDWTGKEQKAAVRAIEELDKWRKQKARQIFAIDAVMSEHAKGVGVLDSWIAARTRDDDIRDFTTRTINAVYSVEPEARDALFMYLMRCRYDTREVMYIDEIPYGCASFKDLVGHAQAATLRRRTWSRFEAVLSAWRAINRYASELCRTHDITVRCHAWQERPRKLELVGFNAVFSGFIASCDTSNNPCFTGTTGNQRPNGKKLWAYLLLGLLYFKTEQHNQVLMPRGEKGLWMAPKKTAEEKAAEEEEERRKNRAASEKTKKKRKASKRKTMSSSKSRPTSNEGEDEEEIMPTLPRKRLASAKKRLPKNAARATPSKKTKAGGKKNALPRKTKPGPKKNPKRGPVKKNVPLKKRRIEASKRPASKQK